MKFEAAYAGRSGIVNGLSEASLGFATNTLREATFFEGTLADPLLLREALAALHAVVVSDFKYRPRDRLAFFAWLADQDRKFLASLGLKSQAVRQKVEAAEARLGELDAARLARLKPFHKARAAFFEYAYKNEYELNYLLDPVITVHPDEVSFEAFSRDESTYARLAAKHALFAEVGAFACGTTNIDFSANLHGELERMRSYRRTRFVIDPGGFTVATGGTAGGPHREKKIDLPDSWVNGFLQVHAAMTLGLTRLSMEPIDLYNVCRFLRRHKARKSPRAVRWELTPGQPVRVVLEPWEHAVELSPATAYQGDKPQSIRTWGRDRLRVLARLIPVCRRVDVYLAGFGMPTIWVLDLGPATFTLALSGWTDNDWTGSAKFGLLTRSLSVGGDELMRTYEAIREMRFGTEADVARAAILGVERARSALSYLCQTGRSMFDLGGGVFRHRDLFPEPFTAQSAAAEAVRAARLLEAADPRAKLAREIYESDNLRIIARRPVSDGYKLSGSARGRNDSATVRPLVHVDREGRIVTAECTCAFAKQHKLTQGPCEHVLALRLAHMERLEAEEASG